MASKSTEDGTYRSSDLYYAAYLQTAGVEMVRTERDKDASKIYFVFDTSIANIEELKQGWFNNTAKVPASLYAYNVKSLKSLCHMK
jgi:hypothetical protein